VALDDVWDKRDGVAGLRKRMDPRKEESQAMKPTLLSLA
jgi:hypothetical protein